MSETTPTWSYCADAQLQVNSVAISDDGSRCVFGTSNEFGEGTFSTYLYKGDGTEVWKKPVSSKSMKQGIFWTAISGDGKYVASGGEDSDNKGFLLAYDESGTSLLDVSIDSRINQVSLSKDGTYMAACYGNVLEVYKFDSSDSQYKSIGKKTLYYSDEHKNMDVYSCEISRDGKTIAACGKIFIENVMKGKAYCLKVSDDDHVESQGSCNLYTGALRVALVDSGDFYAVALHDGSCMLFHQDKADAWEWHYQHDFAGLKLAYAIDATQTDDGTIYVACGANVDGQDYGGLLYMLKSKKHDEHHHTQFEPDLEWTAETKLPINPGVSMDLNANYVTATVGKPKPGSSKESAGGFYLYSGPSGAEQWHYKTKLMNWPMMLARDGGSVFGGSDDGSVYYWKLTS